MPTDNRSKVAKRCLVTLPSEHTNIHTENTFRQWYALSDGILVKTYLTKFNCHRHAVNVLNINTLKQPNSSNETINAST